MQTFVHPLTGPSGETLALDAVWVGPVDAPGVLVICAGTHGAEGFAGSAVETAWLRRGDAHALPDGIAVLLVHALNPYGFAWLRRVNEDNVDLNRHFIEHDAPHPENPGYDALATALAPETIDADTILASQAVLEAYEAEHGLTGLLLAVTNGQYKHAQGLFYGGTAPSWSYRTFAGLLVDRLGRARNVAYLDLHTGLGPYGHGDVASSFPEDAPESRRLRDWCGHLMGPAPEIIAAFPRYRGDSSSAVIWACPQAAVTALSVEFGTRPEWQVLNTLRRDNWLHCHGVLDSEEGRAIKAEVRDAFCPDADDWRQAVQQQGAAVIDSLLAGLAAA